MNLAATKPDTTPQVAAPARPAGPTAAVLVLVAAAFTLINALKPLHIDDSTYYFYALQLSKKPLDMYGFAFMHWNEPTPAIEVLAPPVLPYWWSLAIRLFGDNPFAWKLWLFPVALLFTVSLWSLFRRFAPGLEMPLTILTVFSPVFLPGFNLMTDVPVMALALASVALFCRAADRDSALLALAAGVVCGLAIETKYTALVIPGALFAYSIAYRKYRLLVLAAVGTAFIFIGWESLIALRYGQSHFLYQLIHPVNSEQPRSHLLKAFCPVLGAVAWPVTLVALVGLRLPRGVVLLAGLMGCVPYVLMALPGDSNVASMPTPFSTQVQVDFTCSGALLLLSLVVVAWRLVRREASGGPSHSPLVSREAWFLLCWLLLELAGYIVISPFPAVRRVMGFVVVATIFSGHLAARAGVPVAQRRLVSVVAAASALLGLGYFIVDCQQARTQQWVVQEAMRRIRQEDPKATVWFAGYWGFKYDALHEGMKEIVPQYKQPLKGSLDTPQPTHFRRGDWIVLPSPNIPQQKFLVQGDMKTLVQVRDRVVGLDNVPFATVPGYYSWLDPMRRYRGLPRLEVHLFRVVVDCDPLPSPQPR